MSELVKNLVLFSAAKESQAKMSVSNQQIKTRVGRNCPTEKSYTETCTVYASDLICKQLSLASVNKYKVNAETGGTYSVITRANAYQVDKTYSECSCGLRKSMGIPCRHIFAARIDAVQELFDVSLVAERWLKKKTELETAVSQVWVVNQAEFAVTLCS